MKIKVRALNNIADVFEAAAITQNKGLILPTVKTWSKWLNSEHSMIRCFGLRIELTDVPYYVHVHLVRHKIGCEWFVRSQRPTALNPVEYDRRKAPQDAPINLILDTNPQAIINISQVRLCTKADKNTLYVWNNIGWAIRQHSDPYIATISDVMKKRCIYRGGVCYELQSCGISPHYLEVK